ncbi:MAG: hypothetical protein JXA43_01415 [Candidatus Diapherotrites archaeon]|nr:hypothetical protein [Candidatus Diapherotrites archaeon]
MTLRDRRSLFVLFPIAFFSFICIKYFWILGIVFIIPLLLPLFKKLDMGDTAILSIFSAIVLANFMLNFFLTVPIQGMFWLALFAAGVVCALGIIGIFEHDLLRFLVISNILQVAFVLLDLTVAAMSGKIGLLGTIQIFNYTITGTLIFITLGILSDNGKLHNFSKLHGRFHLDKINATGATVAALSLVGLPGLNIFVSEWYLFVAAFKINAFLSVIGIFAAMILFIMYFKIPYHLFVGKPKHEHPSPWSLKIMVLALTLACIIFGILPDLQLMILT